MQRVCALKASDKKRLDILMELGALVFHAQEQSFLHHFASAQQLSNPSPRS
jgi:hypothetical protein